MKYLIAQILPSLTWHLKGHHWLLQCFGIPVCPILVFITLYIFEYGFKKDMKDDAKKAYIFTDTSTINLKARNFELKGPCHEKTFLNENVGNISGGKDI